MKQDICPNCGAKEFLDRDSYKICCYCSGKFKPKNDEAKQSSSFISLQSDIDVLLKKCQNDPKNAFKYANLVLDIDPTNKDARKYIL